MCNKISYFLMFVCVCTFAQHLKNAFYIERCKNNFNSFLIIFSIVSIQTLENTEEIERRDMKTLSWTNPVFKYKVFTTYEEKFLHPFT